VRELAAPSSEGDHKLEVLLVPGTYSWRGSSGPGDWWTVGSPFRKFLSSAGIRIVGEGHQEYVWSTNLGGINPFSKSDLVVWEAAGRSLFSYLVPPRCPEKSIPPDEVVLLTHSHGLQVALYAASAGLKVRHLIDVSGPVRKDLRAVAEAARPNIQKWTHLHCQKHDKLQFLGELFDGHFGVKLQHPLADENKFFPSNSHTYPLRTPEYFPVLLNTIKETYEGS
jgi:hypothetical protein